MNILIDSLGGKSPGANQLRYELGKALIKTMPKGTSIFFIVPSDFCYFDEIKNVKVIKKNLLNSYFSQYLWYSKKIYHLAKDHKIQIVFSMFGILSKKIYQNYKTVNSVNNMLPFTKKAHKNYKKLSRKFLRIFLLKLLYNRSMINADHIFLMSNHAKNNIEKYNNLLKNKISTCLTGVPSYIKTIRKDNLEHPYNNVPYFLYFSSIYPYKNHIRLIMAYNKIYLNDKDIPEFIIAGLPQDKQYLNELNILIINLKLQDKVKYIGVLPKNKISNWLFHADMNIYGSETECNSIILSEILGVGGVLVCSNVEPMPEITSYASETFNPYNIESIKDTIIKIYNDEDKKNKMRNLSIQRSKELSWKKCGKKFWQIIEKVK